MLQKPAVIYAIAAFSSEKHPFTLAILCFFVKNTVNVLKLKPFFYIREKKIEKKFKYLLNNF
jgi:hypothetical protein